MAAIIRHVDGVRVTEIGGSGEVSFYTQQGRLFAKGNGHPVEMTSEDMKNLAKHLEEMLKEGGWY
jgi:hypothetical protein